MIYNILLLHITDDHFFGVDEEMRRLTALGITVPRGRGEILILEMFGDNLSSSYDTIINNIHDEP